MDAQPSVLDQLRSTGEYLKQHKPPLTQGQVQAMLPTYQADADWTDQNELQLRQSWDNDPLKPYILDSSTTNRYMAPLWRFTARFMGTPVEDIIGPQFNLAYDNSSNALLPIGDQEFRNPNWSTQFCDKLGQLVAHPLWMGHPGAMAICLQYVVKCRTNNQRQMSWPKVTYTSDKFLDLFQNVNRTFQDGTKTVGELRTEASRRMHGIPSRYSLFHTIEERNIRPGVEPIRGPAGVGSDVGTYAIATVCLAAAKTEVATDS